MSLGCWVGCLGTLPPAQAQDIIDQITITNIGPRQVNAALIRSNIRLKKGDPYNRAIIDGDINNLYATGNFKDVRVMEERTPIGISLRYILQGRPVLTEIRFEGNTKFTSKKLLKKITADFSGLPVTPANQGSTQPPKTKMQAMIGQPLDERKVFFYGQEIKKLYEKKGYPKTKVDYVIPADDLSGRTTVTYQITEAEKVRIDDVFFQGVRAFSQGKLRHVIKTRRHWMFSWLTRSGVLKDEQLEDDRETLAEFYRSKGYIDFELKTIKTLRLEPGRIALVFVVHEGQQYKVGAVGFTGVTLFSTNDILNKLKMPVGATFTPEGLAQNRVAIEDFYGSKGYIGPESAHAIPLVARKHANTQTGTMDLTYELEEGEQSRIEKVEIKGNSVTRDRVIRRELAVAPGEVFDMVKVKLSKQRLEGMNIFGKVDTAPEPTDLPNRRNLVVSIDERPTGQVQLGAGLSSIEELFGYVQLGQENFDLLNPPWFRGGGQKVRLHLQYGTVSQRYRLSFVEPWFLGRKLQFSTDLYHESLDYLSLNDWYNERRTGARIGFMRALGYDFLRGSLSYTIENVGLVDVSTNAPQPIRDEEGYWLVSKVGAGLAFDTRRTTFNPYLPDGGQRTEILSELGGGPLGGDTDFYGLELKSSWYFPGFAERHVLEISGRIGVVDNFGSSTNVHLWDRHFLGGIDTLRGYRYRDVGPRIDGEPVGGKTYWMGSLEYSIPIIDYVRLAAFYDIGMVYPDAYSFSTKGFNTGSYNDNWGIGIRLNIPRLGPLRLDYGIPITSDPHNGGSGRFNFSVGWTRDY